MRIGTRSLLLGSHNIILHPIMVAIGWRVHYGFWPKGWRTWIAIIVHDWGYWGRPDLDGPSGKIHPAPAAIWCSNKFGCNKTELRGFWFWFVGGHSRHFATMMGREPSPLMIPDKLATALLPRWLYALQVWMSGEYKEYVAYAHAVGHTEVPSDPWGYAGWLQSHWRERWLKQPHSSGSRPGR